MNLYSQLIPILLTRNRPENNASLSLIILPDDTEERKNEGLSNELCKRVVIMIRHLGSVETEPFVLLRSSGGSLVRIKRRSDHKKTNGP